jgi:putative FmdB family regulatory protein
MPIYEYECQDCGQRHEALQKVSDPPLTECPACGGPLKKLLSAPGLQFKGEGWYVTDYARKSPEKTAPKPSGGEEKTTPAAKAEGGAKKQESTATSGDSASGKS